MRQKSKKSTDKHKDKQIIDSIHDGRQSLPVTNIGKNCDQDEMRDARQTLGMVPIEKQPDQKRTDNGRLSKKEGSDERSTGGKK